MAGQVDDSDLDAASGFHQIVVPKPAVNGQLGCHLFLPPPSFSTPPPIAATEGGKELVKASAAGPR